MTHEELAAALDGCEYGNEGGRDLWIAARQNRLIVVFGYSDDGTELRGAIDDETGGGVMLFDRDGLLANKCDCDDCPYWRDRKAMAEGKVKPIWDEPLDGVRYSWRYETTIPHSIFRVMEDGEPYCLGIVFSLDNLARAQAAEARV